MKNFDVFLSKISKIKKEYAAGQIKLNAAGVFTMIMSGAMDSIISEDGNPIDLDTRLAAIEKFKKAANSSANLPKGRGNEIGMSDIKDEFSRQAWLASINPVHSFIICDFYKDALNIMGFSPTGAKHLRFRKEKTERSDPVDIFGSFSSLFLPRTLQIYGSKNMIRKPAIVGVYQGYHTQTWGGTNQFRKLNIFDGSCVQEAVVWPLRGTNEYERNLAHQMTSCRGQACLFIGRVGISKKGYPSFTVEKIIPFS